MGNDISDTTTPIIDAREIASGDRATDAKIAAAAKDAATAATKAGWMHPCGLPLIFNLQLKTSLDMGDDPKVLPGRGDHP